MKRYYTLTKPKANDDWYYDQPFDQNLTVYEPESPHVFSGLYDAEGKELYQTSRQPIGFILPKDES